MKFFSGFSLQNESYLFQRYRDDSHYCVGGFSYGAIKALRYAQEQLKNNKRLDRVQLFSPAFFQGTSEKFKRLQLLSYKKNKELYLKTFIKSCFKPYEHKIVQQSHSSYEELEELLYYVWDEKVLEDLVSQGVVIEVYLGAKDNIIEASRAKEFFLEYSCVTLIQEANHFLQTN